MARKMEEMAFEAVNKIFAKDDSGAYDCLRYKSSFSWLETTAYPDTSYNFKT
jgi:hypothetical protein